jgi:hypothetical protein
MECLSFETQRKWTKILPLDDTRACISPVMRSPQLLLTGRAPKSLPSSRAHHWATPIGHSNLNTQTSLHTFKSTSKAWAAEAQQDWPINVAINNRLLACKAKVGGALYYAKSALRVGPYLSCFSSNQVISITCFHEPAILKSLELTTNI